MLLGCSVKFRSRAAAGHNSCSSHATTAQHQTGPDISQLSPELQSQWDHESNADLANVVIKPHSHRRVYWTCTQCPDGHPHSWEAKVASRTHGTGCPLCSGHKVCPHNSLPSTAPQVARDWDTAKNSGSPHDYAARSGHQAHWLCNKCGHGWQTRIVNRVKYKSGCPQCASIRQRRRLPTVTASSSSMKQYWDSQRNTEQGLDPDAITIGSGQKANFVCNKCREQQAHTWRARVYDVFRGSGCPYCSSQKVCKCNSLQTLQPDLAAEWCYALNKGTPADYTAKSHREVWWENDKRGRWKASIKRRFYNTCMLEVTSVLNKSMQCCVGCTQPASSCACMIHALSNTPAAVALCACMQCTP